MKLQKLELEKEIPPPTKMSFWPVLDVLAILVFTSVFGSKFVVAPGLTLSLPEMDTPVVEKASEYHVLTIGELDGKEMIIFQDSILDLESFKRRLDSAERRPPPGTVLLALLDSSVSMKTLAPLSEIATNAGYENIQIATEERPEIESEFQSVDEP